METRRSPAVDLLRSYAAVPFMLAGFYLDLLGGVAHAAGEALDKLTNRIEGR